MPMEWGDSVYTVLPIPDDVSQAFEALGAKRVELELNEHSFNLALTKAPVIDKVFVYVGKATLKEASVEPGSRLDVRLRMVDPDVVDVPEDVALALRVSQLSEVWESLTPGKKRGMLQPIQSAKRAETRAKRIEKLLAELNGL